MLAISTIISGARLCTERRRCLSICWTYVNSTNLIWRLSELVNIIFPLPGFLISMERFYLNV